MMQLAVFSLFAGPILAGMGISQNSDMAPTATSYMKLRAFGAPAATLWLVANGIFRGTFSSENANHAISIIVIHH